MLLYECVSLMGEILVGGTQLAHIAESICAIGRETLKCMWVEACWDTEMGCVCVCVAVTLLCSPIYVQIYLSFSIALSLSLSFHYSLRPHYQQPW